MRNFTRIFLIFTLILIVLNACKDDDFPDPTETGENELACKINGEVWTSGVVSGVNQKATEAVYSSSSRYAVITARRIVQGKREVIEISLQGVTGTGEYSLGGKGASEGTYRLEQDNDVVYNTTATRGGKVEINRFDIDNRIIAGEFSFNAINAEGDIVAVESGWFDMIMVIH